MTTAALQPPRTSRATWPARGGLAFIAFAGTAVYAASFGLVEGGTWLAPAGVAIGVAAGLSWVVFGGVLLLLTGGRPAPLAWADACLRTMAAGIAVLLVAALFNALAGPARPPAWFVQTAHVVLLLNANAVMAAVFYRQARALGLGLFATLAAWMCGLNGAFALIMMALYQTGAVSA